MKKIHFIGIGGVGMSGIARVAHDQGYVVTGSDLRASRYTDQLVEAGIRVVIGHSAQTIAEVNPDIVVVSTAILKNNPEYQAAINAGCTIWHRAQMLAELGRGKKTLACAGTHGKTTTSSMLASVLDGMGLDPSFLIGGIVRTYNTNAHSGSGQFYAVEADESDKSFTYLDPFGMIITNIEADHLDHYEDLAEIYDKFAEFMRSCDPSGAVVVCADDVALLDLAKSTNPKHLSYGFSEAADVRICSYEQRGISSYFELVFPDGQVHKACIAQNPGKHNISNAAGVITLIYALGLDVAAAVDALKQFAGVRRRFDLVAELGGITIVDDYAHHPTEIAATIKAAKQLDFKRVIVLFQPHRYSRVKLFCDVLRDEFSHAFDACDQLYFMDVYPAGEAPVPGVNGKTFLDVAADGAKDFEAHYIAKRSETAANLAKILQPGDLLITMGAGDVTSIGPELAALLRKV